MEILSAHGFRIEVATVSLSAAIMIEAIYELTREKMKATEIDGVPKTKNQVIFNFIGVDF